MSSLSDVPIPEIAGLSSKSRFSLSGYNERFEKFDSCFIEVNNTFFSINKYQHNYLIIATIFGLTWLNDLNEAYLLAIMAFLVVLPTENLPSCLLSATVHNNRIDLNSIPG